jgi:hypothetical protein
MEDNRILGRESGQYCSVEIQHALGMRLPPSQPAEADYRIEHLSSKTGQFSSDSG